MAATTRRRSEPSRRLKERADELLQQEISFIYAAEFESLDDSQLREEAPEAIHQPDAAGTQAAEERGDALGGPLLTAEGERHLFRLMNFLKYRANVLRSRLNPARPARRTVEAIDRALRQAQAARGELVQSNVRLVASLAHKFSASGVDYEDLLSEGNLILVKAVDKFDYSRGFRFSTYATHSIQRHFYRVINRRHRRKTRETAALGDALEEMIPEREQDPPLDHRVAEVLIRHFDECLDERERTIIEERFGLREGEDAGTLQSVAESVGLSKERVRQIQMKAVEKLQDLAIRLKLRLECPI
jgi:RNA polymerase primary sigma factor